MGTFLKLSIFHGYEDRLFSFDYSQIKILWIVSSTIIVINFLAIGAKKLWIYRKEQLQAAQLQVINQNQQPQQQNNAFLFNNAIHNDDVMSMKLHIIACTIAVALFLLPLLSSFFIDKNSKNHLAIRFFIIEQAKFLARAVLLPIMFFAFNKDARRHVKTTFWNEWAPDFLQAYDPNRVQEIKLKPNRTLRV